MILINFLSDKIACFFVLIIDIVYIVLYNIISNMKKKKI